LAPPGKGSLVQVNGGEALLMVIVVGVDAWAGSGLPTIGQDSAPSPASAAILTRRDLPTTSISRFVRIGVHLAGIKA
jgi:hypothetical protein